MVDKLIKKAEAEFMSRLPEGDALTSMTPDELSAAIEKARTGTIVGMAQEIEMLQKEQTDVLNHKDAEELYKLELIREGIRSLIKTIIGQTKHIKDRVMVDNLIDNAMGEILSRLPSTTEVAAMSQDQLSAAIKEARADTFVRILRTLRCSRRIKLTPPTSWMLPTSARSR